MRLGRDGSVIEWREHGSKFERTETGSRSIAAAAFEALIKHDDLEKTPVSAHLVFLRTTLAIHQFDALEGAENNWLGIGPDPLAGGGYRPGRQVRRT